ncbi:MAG: type II toxin-antitoxin system VapC family toxin [Gemmatales bacterium]
MAIYVLDTDTLSLYQRNHSSVVSAITVHSTDQLSISTVTVEEQISGWSALARAARTPQRREQASIFLSTLVQSWNRFALAPFTMQSIMRFDSIRQLKLNVKNNDLRIAATALELRATVVTRNLRDFGRVPGLLIEDWSK